MSFINYTQLDDKSQTPCKHFNDHKPSNEKSFVDCVELRVLYIKQAHAEFVDFFNKVWLNKLSREPRNVGEKLKQGANTQQISSNSNTTKKYTKNLKKKTENLERTKLQIK